MAEGEVSTKGITVRSGSGINWHGFHVHDGRITLSDQTGESIRMPLRDGAAVYGSVGVTSSIGARYHGSREPLHAENRQADRNRLNNREARRLLNDIRQLTGGSYDIGTVPLMTVAETLLRYPVGMPDATLSRLTSVYGVVSDLRANLEKGRQYIYADLKQRGNFEPGGGAEAYEAILGRPVTHVGLDNFTVNDLRRENDRAVAQIKQIEQATGILSAPTAVVSRRLDAWLAQNQPGITLSATEKTKLIDAVRDAAAYLTDLQAKMLELPTPAQIKKAHDISERIETIAPELSLGVFGAAAYQSAPWQFAGQKVSTVVGAVHEQGLRLDKHGVLVLRNGQDVGLRITPTHWVEQTLVAGVGTVPALAIPHAVANKLDLVPGANGIGVYAALRHAEARLAGVRESETSLAVGGVYGEVRGGGRYQYAEVELGCGVKPSTDCKVSARAGLKF